jgi:3-hydroxyisobutyrate dehydrogenase
MQIGIAGTGKMGSAIATRLLGLGHQVSVWNRTAERAAPLLQAGAAWAASPRELAGRADTVITIVTDAAALDHVYGAGDGLLATPSRDALFIDMSTVPPERQQAMGARAAAGGAAYLECPVGGSVGPARDGKLLGLAGGAPEHFARARPLLELLCRRVEHLGPLGAGSAMKLAINLPLMVYWQTLGEALSLVQPLGLDPARVVDIFSDSSGGPNMLKVRGPMIAQALAGTGGGQVTVDLATMRKDVRSMLAQGALEHVRMPVTSVALDCMDGAAGDGLDGADCTQLLVWWLGQGARR